jgi:hypothetical protein
MPTPASGSISMQDVNTETNFTMSMYNFYSTSSVGGAGGLMYHNLAMGPSNAQTAKQAIYDPFNAGASGANLTLSGWYNYNQTPNCILDINLINNNTENDLAVDIFLRDPATTTDYAINGNPYNLINTNGSDVGLTDFDTGVSMNSTNFTAGVYQILFNITANYIGPPPPPGGGVTGNTTSAADTDGVGPGTVRTFTPTSPPNFDAFTPIIGVALVRGNITGNNGIYINKRTTFTITFN